MKPASGVLIGTRARPLLVTVLRTIVARALRSVRFVRVRVRDDPGAVAIPRASRG